MSDIKVNIKVEVRESIIEACERIRREAEALNPANNLPMFVAENKTLDVDFVDVTEERKLLQP